MVASARIAARRDVLCARGCVTFAQALRRSQPEVDMQQTVCRI